MNQLGVSVMLHMLMGDHITSDVISQAIGKTISDLRLKDDMLRFSFSDGFLMDVYDDGQSCCEHRYITTDDDLSQYIGATLVSIEIADGGETVSEYDEVHQIQFLRVSTSTGMFVCETHNEHNGWYGGFSIVARQSHM